MLGQGYMQHLHWGVLVQRALPGQCLPIHRRSCPLLCHVVAMPSTLLPWFAAKARCPDAAYHPLRDLNVYADGRDVVVTAFGYNTSSLVFSNGNPSQQTDETCRCTQLELLADPDNPCEVYLTCRLNVDVIKRCPAVSRTIVGGDTEQFSMLAHIGSLTWVTTDPRGQPVFRMSFQPFPMAIKRTLTATARTSLVTVSGVQWMQFELGDFYYNKDQKTYHAEFVVWLNRIYAHGEPSVESVPTGVLPENVRISRKPSLDNCPDDKAICGHGYAMDIVNADSACGLEGPYELQTPIRCADLSVCPNLPQRLYPVEVKIEPGEEACSVCRPASSFPSSPRSLLVNGRYIFVFAPFFSVPRSTRRIWSWPWS